jgi:hypothetical protein
MFKSWHEYDDSFGKENTIQSNILGVWDTPGDLPANPVQKTGC